MPLSEYQIRAAKPREKPYKLTDSQGLVLLVSPTGARLWRLRYRFAGREGMISVGSYPATSLKEARERRDVNRRPRLTTFRRRTLTRGDGVVGIGFPASWVFV